MNIRLKFLTINYFDMSMKLASGRLKYTTRPDSNVGILYTPSLIMGYGLEETRLTDSIQAQLEPMFGLINRGRGLAPAINPAILAVPYSAIEVDGDTVKIDTGRATIHRPDQIKKNWFSSRLNQKNTVILTDT